MRGWRAEVHCGRIFLPAVNGASCGAEDERRRKKTKEDERKKNATRQNPVERLVAMAQEPELDEAYRTAEYYIEDDPPIRFEIDQPHQGLALLLMSFDVEQAVWITAYNPGSQPHSEDDNLTNQMQLLERIETMRLNYFVGHSCDAAGDWFEPGYLVLGMDEAVGIELGREFGQHAVVFIQPSGEPKLRRITR